MRIGVLTPEYPPYKGGGIGTATVSFVKNMAQAGHSIHVFTILRPEIKGYDPLKDIDIEDGDLINIHYFSYKLESNLYEKTDIKVLENLEKQDISLVKSWIVAKKLRRFLNQQKLDVIFSAEYLGLPAYFLLEEKMKPIEQRTPLILTLHTGQRELNFANYLSTKNIRLWEREVVELEKLSIDMATLLHCPSNFLSTFIKVSYDVDKEIEVIPYFPAFVDIKKYQITKNFNEREKRILFIGRLERRKGFKEFILAAKRLLSEDIDYKFIIAGGEWHDEFTNSNYSEEVLRLIPENLTDNFEFKGLVSHEDLPSLITSADLVIVPSLFENYPNTCMEPVQLGVPVLVSRDGGMTEILGDEPDTSFDPSSISEIAAKIKSFLDLPDDKKKEIAVRQNTFFREKHDSDKLIASYEKLVSEAKRLCNSSNKYLPPKNMTIGIGIPIFNTGHYIDECIESVLSQTRLPDRIIIVDDGSTDRITIDKLKKWEAKSNKIEVIRQENKGLCATRNRVIDMMESEDFILLLDSDDKLHPDYLSKTEQYMINSPDVAACTTWVEKFGEDSGIWAKPPFSFPDALIQNMIISSVALIRRSSLPTDVRFDERLSPFTAEDWDFWINFHKRNNEIAIIPEPLFLYRVRKGSKWHSLNFRKYLVIMDHLINSHEAVYRKYMNDVMITLFANNFSETNNNIWAKIANALPSKLIFLFRKNAFIKNIGYRLLTGR